MNRRILIVGGVAGGASCAARARRLDEQAEILIFERGSHVSFANCGLPYYVGNIIREEASLLVASPDLFQKRFNIQVRLQSEVIAIHRQTSEIQVRSLPSGRVYRDHYDALAQTPATLPISED